MKWIMMLAMAFTLAACQSEPERSPQSLGSFGNEAVDTSGSENVNFAAPLEQGCFAGENSNFASNEKITINGKTYPEDTHFTIYQTDDGLQAIAHLEDKSGQEKDAHGSYDIIDKISTPISCDKFTSIPTVADKNGEIQLGEYSLPIDYKVAGKRKSARKRSRKGGVTYCYREVKRIVRNKIKLTGGSAYMANAQLKRAGWKRYASYGSAPSGSVCVFGAGGKRTPSGGHKHGHVGIKGLGGVVNPQSGFSLGRPFLGCYDKA